MKERFIAKAELSYTVANLRFFCMGKELSDDLFIYSYNITDEMTILCMKKAIPVKDWNSNKNIKKFFF